MRFFVGSANGLEEYYSMIAILFHCFNKIEYQFRIYVGSIKLLMPLIIGSKLEGHLSSCTTDCSAASTYFNGQVLFKSYG